MFHDNGPGAPHEHADRIFQPRNSLLENDRGMGLCVNTLPAPRRPLGVPHYFTVRGILEADSLAGAVRAVARAERAIPANIILATPDGPADLEVTIDDVRVLRDGGTGVATHTNHCLHQDLLAVNDDFPELIDSYARKRRIEFVDALPKTISGKIQRALLRSRPGRHDGRACRPRPLSPLHLPAPERRPGTRILGHRLLGDHGGRRGPDAPESRQPLQSALRDLRARVGSPVAVD